MHDFTEVYVSIDDNRITGLLSLVTVDDRSHDTSHDITGSSHDEALDNILTDLDLHRVLLEEVHERQELVLWVGPTHITMALSKRVTMEKRMWKLVM